MILEPRKIKSDTDSTVSPSIYHEVIGPDAMIFVFASWQMDGETMETVKDYFIGLQKSLQIVTAAMKLKDACSLVEKL